MLFESVNLELNLGSSSSFSIVVFVAIDLLLRSSSSLSSLSIPPVRSRAVRGCFLFFKDAYYYVIVLEYFRSLRFSLTWVM
jgi:hypothetical protein